MRSLIIDPFYLANFEAHIQNYRNSGNWESEAERLASQFLQLYRDHPQQSVYDNIHPNLFSPDEVERKRAWQYIGFYWSGVKRLFELIGKLCEILNYYDHD